MGDHAHGMTDVYLRYMNAAIAADHEVNTKRTTIARPNIYGKPQFNTFTYLKYDRKASFNLLIRPRNILLVHAATSLKIRISEKKPIHIFQSQIGYNIATWFDDDTTLFGNCLQQPVSVDVS